MSRPFECRWTESDTMLEPAFSRRADLGSKKSALRPTSCTGQLTVSSSRMNASGSCDRSSLVGSSTCVRQIMWWNTKRPPTVARSGAGVRVDVVDFLDFERRDVAILGEPGRNARNLTPPVGRGAFDQDLVRLDDEIGRADAPTPDDPRRPSRAACRPGCPSARRCRPTWRAWRFPARSATGRSWNCWMPMFFSMYHGGMTPAFGPMPVRCLMARAHGRASS